MAVTSDQVRLSIQAGNSVLLTHDFQFKIFSKTDIKCWKQSAAGVRTLGVVDVDYTVSFSATNESGTVTWVVAPVTSGYSIIAGSEMAFTQGTEFPRDTAIPNSTFRNAFDRACILIQQLSDVLFGRAILWDESLYLAAREQVTITTAPVTRRALIYVRNSGDTGWNIEPSTYDPDTNVAAAAASATAAAASATAAASSATSASSSATAAAASASAMVGTSGVRSARPAGGASRTWYYATDEDQEYMWSPTALKWYLVG